MATVQKKSDDLGILIAFLKNDKIIQGKLHADVIKFLNTSSDENIYKNLISRINWITNSENCNEIEQAINHKLIYHGELKGISPSFCTRVANRLIREMFAKASDPNYEKDY